MNLVQNVTAPQFKGLLILSSKNMNGEETTTAINTKHIVTINNEKYRDFEEEHKTNDEEIKINNGTYMTLIDGSDLRISAPVDKVIDAYARAKEDGMCEVKTKYPVDVYDTLIY